MNRIETHLHRRRQQHRHQDQQAPEPLENRTNDQQQDVEPKELQPRLIR